MADTLGTGAIQLARLTSDDMPVVARAASENRLDFDDAYQHVAAEKLGLTIVSFDADFDHTPKGRRTPADVLASPPQK